MQFVYTRAFSCIGLLAKKLISNKTDYDDCIDNTGKREYTSEDDIPSYLPPFAYQTEK